MSVPRTVWIAGSTGSIGTQALDVMRSSGGRFEITALGARSSVTALAAQAHDFHPAKVAIADATKADELAELVPRVPRSWLGMMLSRPSPMRLT